MTGDKVLRKKDLEILAPVGGKNHLRAAVENGADAIYLGGRSFNARIKADNFSDEELLWALDYAHMRNVKVYAALNTLIMDDELMTAYEYAKFLYEAGVDALILQDVGFAQLVRRGMPDLHLHLSTQGSIYNSSGVRMAEELGFERVVLARELALKDIEEIARECRADIEVFVHGALCICYSGQCQMSRLSGGRSGNRGLCAQPCRLGYNGHYPLSPKDLCTIDSLGDLVEAGVKSFKIEGRMKTPEYVAVVTAIYRKYLDRYLKDGHYKVDPEDRWALNQVFNRGGFTEGYLFQNPGSKLITEELPKHQGVYLGKVKQKLKNNLVDIIVDSGGKLRLGDGIEIRSDKLPGNVVTYIEDRGAGNFRIGDIKGAVSPGDKVFKISDKELNRTARSTYEPLTDGMEKYRKKVPVKMIFTAKEGEKIILTVSEIQDRADSFEQVPVTVTVESDVRVEKALKRTIQQEEIFKQLSKTGAVPYEVHELEIHLDDGIAMPLSVINALRRKAVEELTHHKIDQSRRQSAPLHDAAAKQWMEEVLIASIHEPRKANHRSGVNYIPLYDYMMSVQNNGRMPGEDQTARTRPYIYNISKGRLDHFIRENFEKIVEACKETGISIGNPGWIKEFIHAGVRVYGDYGLNIVNRLSEAVFEALGVQEPLWSLEIIEDRSGGDIPLMITEHIIPEKILVCRNGKEYPVIRTSLGDKCIICSGYAPIRKF